MGHTRKQANDEEVRLHNLYDVAINPEFYNKAKVKDNGFCTEGMTTVINKLTGEHEFVTVEESKNKSKYRGIYEDVVNATNILTGEKVKVTKNEYKNNPNLVHTVKGTVTVIDTETGIRRQVTQEEFRNNPNLVGQQIGRVNVVDTRTGKRKSVTKEDFEKYDYYVHSTKGLITVIDIIDGSFKSVTKDEYKNNDRYKHRSSKIIHIFNTNNDLMYKAYGNFSKVCKTYGLPKVALKESYQQNGKPLYENPGSNLSRLEKAGYLKFKGWYAKEVSL